MPSKLIKMPYDDLTYRIIGCAMAVHRKRGPGCRENTCQRDLEVHFTESGSATSFRKKHLSKERLAL